MTTLPFKAEYAKTGRAGCKLCKTPIEKASLRLAIMVQSRFHDGKDAHWFHHGCFFQKQRPPSVGDIEDFEALRYEDQEMIKKKIGSGGAAAAAGSSGKGKGSKKAAAESATDFLVAYAKSAKSACVACEEFIPKKAVRISKKDFTSERAMLYGGGNGMDRWHHLDCFVKIREEIEFFAGAKVIPGFKDLDREDQEMLTKKLPAIAPKRKLEDNGAASEGPSKKMKTEAKGKSGKDPEEEVIRKQNKLMYKYRDLVEGGLKKPQLIQVLTTNKQIVPEGNPKAILDLIADIMTFGAMKKCTDCGSGQFSYKSGVGYQCTGYISEFTKCDYVVDGDVERVPFKIPNDLRDHEVFENYQFKMQERVIPKHAAPIKGRSFDSSGSSSGPKLNKKPLAGFKFAISGVSSKELPKMEEKIKEFGGDLGSKCNAKLAGVITTKDEFNKPSKTVQQAQKFGVPVVSTDFVSNLRELNYKLADEMKKCLLGDWVEDLQGRLKTLNDEFEKPKERRRTGGIEETHLQSIKLKLKDGAVIDPDSGLDDGPYHVYKEGKLYYNCVMNLTSVEDGKNSFYKIQIIESDGSPKSYDVFRAWGRIGTTIGGHQTDPQGCREDAIDFFCEKYKEKTGNVWGTKFVKKPGCYIALDIDYGQSEQEQKQLIPSLENSRLPLPVQSLISLIFDVNIMKQTLLEFELDMEKMPLGKISRKQLLEAYSVLTDSLNLRGKETDDRKLKRLITDVSNRFYTLIPHNFGTRMPPLLDNDALLKTKIEMLDNLMEIEIAYELLAQGDKGESGSIDSYYDTLNAEIDILEAHSEEFKIIKKYLMNTHAPTHSNYTLELDQVFKVIRKGENKRYRPFKDLHNRRLLWHGSRITNFAGIVSQGLRIAPPEAPVTGYMFGKGIYFADMVSKSANYCNTSRDNPTGLLLLCEVALGDMYVLYIMTKVLRHELKQAKDTISKPPKPNHSVKGLGQTEPDPKETHTFSDGVMVPYGKPVTSKAAQNSALLYNEYIVYDIAQVNIKYLLRVNFKYGGRR